MRKRDPKLRIAALAAALAAAAACRPKTASDEPAEPAAESAPEPASEPAPTEPASNEPVEILYPGAPGSFVGLAEDIAPGIVSVRSTRKVLGGPAEEFPGIEDDYALGTGFFIDNTGYILTNNHVLANSPEVRVRMHDGTERQAIIAGRDSKLDIALLKIDDVPPRQITVIDIGDSERTRVGEWVLAVGDPFGMGASFSAGIVSHKGDAPIGPTGEFVRTYLQTDANIHSGNSGGPLVNLTGEVIGINVAVDSRKAKVGYAIPIEQATRILPQLKTNTVSRAWLGARVLPVTAELARQLGVDRPTGAFVTEVIKNGPAERAGIKKNDVIMKYDKRPVDEKSLAWIAATTGIGRRIEVVLWRNGGERIIELTSEAMPQ